MEHDEHDETGDEHHLILKDEVSRLRELARLQPSLSEMVESHLFWKSAKRHGKTFWTWLAGFVAFAVAVRDLFGVGKHGG